MSYTEEDHDEILRMSGEAGTLPLRSPCPAGCRFCYENTLHRFSHSVRLLRSPPFTDGAFERYYQSLTGSDRPLTPVSPVFVEDGTVFYSSMSDIFCQGLDLPQIDRLLSHNDRHGSRGTLPTTGNHLSPETASELTRRYPDSFRLSVSVMTFSPTLRETLFSRGVDSETIQALVRALRSPKIYLCHLDPAQTLSDLETLHQCADPDFPPEVIIARLHATRLHPEDIQSLAAKSGEGFDEVISWLMQNRDGLSNLGSLYVHCPPEAYTWTFRHALEEQLAPYELGVDDAVVCSVGAYEAMRRHVIPKDTVVIPVSDSLGGTTSLTTTISNERLVEVVREGFARSGAARRLFVPSSIWWIGDQAALDGGTVEDVRAAFPGVEVCVVDIPMEMRQARLTVQECADYYASR